MKLPEVSFRDWTHGTDAERQRFIAELGTGLEAHGFVAVRDAPVPSSLLDAAYGSARRLFALGEDDKRGCERPEIGRQRGYTPFGVEHAKDRDIADLKEFWQVGRSGNLYPPAAPEAEDVFGDLFECLDALGSGLLDAVGAYLQVPEGFFRELTEQGNTVMRVIHYPPLPHDAPEEAVRAAPHEDINLLTVLPVSTASGLQLLDREGRWVEVEAAPDAVIVDTGDMMALLTGGRLPATTHRVVNPTSPEARSTSRFSMPMFVHPRPEARLTPLDDLEGPDGPTAAEFLHERLVAIGVA